jgi:PPP family 3-phenylpropionic acid transporter
MYEQLGAGIYGAMALMAAVGSLLVWLARDGAAQPQSAASGG